MRKSKNKHVGWLDIPDTIVWIIYTICVASKSLPVQPAHWWRSGQTIIKTFNFVIDQCRQHEDTPTFHLKK